MCIRESVKLHKFLKNVNMVNCCKRKNLDGQKRTQARTQKWRQERVLKTTAEERIQKQNSTKRIQEGLDALNENSKRNPRQRILESVLKTILKGKPQRELK